MKIKIRNSLFETNSSSIHSIAIYNDREEISIPSSVILTREDFGWTTTKRYTYVEKLNYFLEMCLGLDYEEENLILKKDDGEEYCSSDKILGLKEDSYTQRFIDILKQSDIDVEYYLGSVWDGGIDHNDWEKRILEELLNDKDKLFKFLFGNKSFLATGNDNNYTSDEYWETLNGDNNFEVFYKYN